MEQQIIKQKIDSVKLRICVTINEQCIVVSIPTLHHLYVQPLTQHVLRSSYCPALRFSKLLDHL
jgi:hypothetical protein